MFGREILPPKIRDLPLLFFINLNAGATVGYMVLGERWNSLNNYFNGINFLRKMGWRGN